MQNSLGLAGRLIAVITRHNLTVIVQGCDFVSSQRLLEERQRRLRHSDEIACSSPRGVLSPDEVDVFTDMARWGIDSRVFLSALCKELGPGLHKHP
jgi:hypothetical protein